MLAVRYEPTGNPWTMGPPAGREQTSETSGVYDVLHGHGIGREERGTLADSEREDADRERMEALRAESVNRPI
jgi:hypothetical protein